MNSTQHPDAKRIAVSPKYTLDKLSRGRLEDKVDVFEDQVMGWVLDHARALTSESYEASQHCGIAVLMLSCSYFESIAAFKRGEWSKNRSAEFFRDGLAEVFPDIVAAAKEEDPENWEQVFKDFAGTFYDDLRCGLFHDAAIRCRIIIKPKSNLELVIDTTNHRVATIIIDPAQFLAQIEKHFRSYVVALRDPKETGLRSNFEQEFDRRASQPAAVISPELLG